MIWPRRDAISAVDAGLTALEEALHEPRADRLGALERRLAEAIGRLPEAPPDAQMQERLARLRARAARLGQLLEAARAGARDAREALTTPRGFSSYDAQGRTGQVGRPRPHHEQRR